MSTMQALDQGQMVKDFEASYGTRLPSDALASLKAAIATQTTAHPAHGSVAGIVLYDKVQVVINNGKTFDGDAWGLGGVGGGALFGNVYTDDLDALYRNTKRFQFTGTPVYVSVIFLDGSNRALGTFQSGGVSTVVGVSGGSGSWS